MPKTSGLIVIGLLFVALAPRPLSAQTAPGMPQNVQALVSTDNTVLTVSWTAPPSGGATPTGYILEFRVRSTLVLSIDAGNVTSKAIAIPPGVEGMFNVTVVAVANGVSGPGSNARTFIVGGTGPCTGPPPPPERLGFMRRGIMLTFIWDPAFTATDYILEAGSVSGGTDLYNGSMGTATTITAPIPENVHAFVRVRARNACGVSLVFNEVEVGAMWTFAFRPGLNVDPCFPPGIVFGGFCSQVAVLRGSNSFEEIWSPMTPGVRVRGTLTTAEVTGTLQCTNNAASGVMQATWDGEKYVGTITLGSASTNLRVFPGSYDPECRLPF